MILPRGSILKLTDDTLTTTGTLTEHGRTSFNLSNERIGSKDRMFNGDMRASFVAKKNTISVSWTDLPTSDAMTADGFKGGKWIKDFYDNNTGTVTADLLYDATDLSMTMLITSFDYDVTRRTTGPGNYDLVSINMTLEEI